MRKFKTMGLLAVAALMLCAVTITYADDTTLIISATILHTLQLHAQTDLNSLVSYLYANNLVPNPTKTTYISAGRNSASRISGTSRSSTVIHCPNKTTYSPIVRGYVAGGIRTGNSSTGEVANKSAHIH